MYVRWPKQVECYNGGRHGLLCRCQHQSLLNVSGHVLVLRDTSLKNVHSATRILASALCCGRTRGRERPAQVTLLPVLHRRHIRKWLTDILMSSHVLQATQNNAGLIPRCTGTLIHRLTNQQTRSPSTCMRDSGHSR